MRLWKFQRSSINKNGFTVVEMMVTMGIFAIMAAIAVPSYLSMQPGLRLNGGAREVLGRLMWARARAVELNTTYTVTFPTSSTLQISGGGGNQTIDIQANYPGITFSKIGSDPTFNGRGTAGGSTTITVSNGSSTRTVTVSATGNVRVI